MAATAEATATRPRPAPRWTAERRFYTAWSVALLLAVLVGFARSFYLRPWFPDWPAAREPVFYVHGVVFTAWMVLLVVQARLIGVRRIAWHRTLGWLGLVLAVAMTVLGVYASLVAARRPGGFIGVPVPPLEFLAVPLVDIPLFAIFTGIAIALRNRPQSHKRWMMLGSINLLPAAVGRWPGPFAASPLIGFGTGDLFLVPLVAWDLWSRRRLHPATVIGCVVIVAMQPLRFAIAGTAAWQRLAGWAVGLLG